MSRSNPEPFEYCQRIQMQPGRVYSRCGHHSLKACERGAIQPKYQKVRCGKQCHILRFESANLDNFASYYGKPSGASGSSLPSDNTCHRPSRLVDTYHPRSGGGGRCTRRVAALRAPG